MSIIALVGNKGGAGKTTLAVNLAAGLARQQSVVMIDADPQSSALQWRAIAGDASAPPVAAAEADLQRQAIKLLQDYRCVVIDCPPSVHAPQTGAVLGDERLEALEQPGGITDCGNAQNCVKVCPKDIPLTESIAAIGRQTTVHAIKSFFAGR